MTFDETADGSARPGSAAPTNPPSADTGHARGTRRSRTGALIAAAAMVTVAIAAGAGVTRNAAAHDGAATPASDAAERALGWKGNEDFWRRQNQLLELNTFIDDLPGIETSGYVESVNNPDALSTTLLWHGPADRTQQTIKQKAHELGITVTVEQGRYSRRDLDRALKALEGRSGQGAFTNFMINIWGLTADFDGVVVTGEYRHPPTGSRAEADAALARAATAELGVAIAIEHGGPPTLA
nr:alpha-lytic protease [uncultured bacterium]